MRHALKTLGGRLGSAAARLARHPRTPAAATGLVVGVAAWSTAHPFVLRFGFNHETLAALVAAAAAAFTAGLSLRRLDRHGLPAVIAAGWLVLLPLMLAAAEVIATAAPASALGHVALRLPLLAVGALVALGVPAACVGILLARRVDAGDGPTLLVAAGLGVAFTSLGVAPLAGLHAPLLVIALGTAVVWFVRILRGAPTSDAAPEPSTPLGRVESLCAAATGTVVAILAATAARGLAQLTPEAGYLVAAGAAALLVGAGLGVGLAPRLRRTCGEPSARTYGALIAATAGLAPLAAFPWLVGRHLDADAFVSSVTWLMTIRIATVAAVFLPLGLGFGLTARPSARRAALTGLAAGLAVSPWLLPVMSVVPLALAAAAAVVVLNGHASRDSLPRSRKGWAAAGLAAVCLVAVVGNVGRYEPARAARLLFSTQTFIARQGGVPGDLLPYLDDARLVAAVERPDGTATVWKQRGAGYVVRIDGVPAGATVTRPDVCPLPSADVLRVALPLVLHDDPESVLLLGDPAGLATATAIGFPVREITCYDPPDGVRAAAARCLPRVSDDRLTARAVEPRLALAAERRVFDVIVSDPGTPMLPAAAPYFTREFYAAAARRLAEEGVFCQRLRYADLGPAPLRTLAATTRGLFGEAMTIEAGSGEYLLVACRRGSSLVRAGLVERLQRPHVRRTLAALGWDWSVPLNLASLEQEGLDALAAEARGPNTDSNARLAYALPQEVMRWGPKNRELQQATAGKTSRLFVRGVPEDQQRDVLDRLAEVAGQRNLMTKYPDQPWAYRKEVRTQLKESPRSVIRPVAGEIERTIHPEDQRRLDYFAALGEASREPTPDALAELERFAEPYDPLLTYFLHHEAAPLYARLGPAGSAAELAHRLHAAYFADYRDRSVRNVLAAMELIVAHPELVPDGADRFDQLNGLVEQLLARWKARGMAEPRSPEVVILDIDKSLDGLDAALAAMRPLARDAGLSERDWRLRTAAIDRTLTRPLRTYRSSLLPHLRAARKAAGEKAAEATEGSGEAAEAETSRETAEVK